MNETGWRVCCCWGTIGLGHDWGTHVTFHSIAQQRGPEIDGNEHSGEPVDDQSFLIAGAAMLVPLLLLAFIWWK